MSQNWRRSFLVHTVAVQCNKLVVWLQSVTFMISGGESLKTITSVHDPSLSFIPAPNKKENVWVMETSELFLRTHLRRYNSMPMASPMQGIASQQLWRIQLKEILGLSDYQCILFIVNWNFKVLRFLRIGIFLGGGLFFSIFLRLFFLSIFK